MQPLPPRSAFHTVPARRRVWPQVWLSLATAATTFAAGVVGWEPVVLGIDADLAGRIGAHWQRGLVYMAAVMGVLGAHEAGHFVAAVVHRIPATLPIFIPMPVLLTGTLGAVIGMEGSRADRRQLFDIAIAGPIAGLVVILPVLAAGMLAGQPTEASPFATPPVAAWLQSRLRPDLAPGASIAPNPLFMAGWVGLLVTGLNMIPVSQLDGGHVSYAIFGRRAHWIARAILLAAIAAIVVLGRYNWIAMVVIVALMGTDHPPIRDDGEPLGLGRTLLGLVSLLIPIVTFMPEPLLFE
ncbi:MAG: site-2 protease family protein [Planctomycetia bacterium]|nr:site-2 protease family protein [Planctomycetia bacterium]